MVLSRFFFLIKNYGRSPRTWTVTDFSYSKLCQAALVGVDKETWATDTLGFPREGRRRNKLWQLNPIGHDRRYLSLCLDTTKESWKGGKSSHICFLCCSKAVWYEALRQSRNSLSTCTFDKFHMTIVNPGHRDRVPWHRHFSIDHD